MIVLAIDTAGTGCYAALYDSDRDIVLGAAGDDIGRGHAERLMEFVDAALDAAGTDIKAVGRIAVTVGPGSFTGIRVGVAAARGRMDPRPPPDRPPRTAHGTRHGGCPGGPGPGGDLGIRRGRSQFSLPARRGPESAGFGAQPLNGTEY